MRLSPDCPITGKLAAMTSSSSDALSTAIGDLPELLQQPVVHWHERLRAVWSAAPDSFKLVRNRLYDSLMIEYGA